MKKTYILLCILTQLLFSCKITIGISKKLKKSTEDAALNFLIKEKIPGMAISVSKKGKVIWSKGFGYADIENEIKIYPDTSIFRIASVSKPISAIALATLVDQKKLNFDISLYTYLPDYPKKKYDFTIRQLGGHTAGIRSYTGNEFLLNKKLSITEGLSVFKNDSLLFKPQTDYKYNTYDWCILSEVAQKITKIPFDLFVDKAVFTPLNMSSTSLDVSDSIIPNRAKNYTKTKTGEIVLSSEVNVEYKAAGGGFISTSKDLIKFGNEVLRPKLISESTLKELLTPQTLDSGKSTNYGFGISIGETKQKTPIYGHSGNGVGASSLLLIYPKEKIVIVILTNLTAAPVFDLAEKLENIIID